jgi:SSS family transporter
MPTKLATLDVLVVVLYVLGTTLLGVWFTRGQRDVNTYFVGDRNVSWWLVLVSIVATETSTVTFLSVPGLAFKQGGNLTFLQLAFGYVIGRILIAGFLLPQYLRGQWLSAYQLLRQRFDVRVQRTASGLFLITRTVADGLRLYLTALLLHQFTGWNVSASIVAMGLITLAYTYLGGMQAVIWTDLIQFVIYILGAVVAAGCILANLPDGVRGFLDLGDAAGKFRLINPTFDLGEEYTLWAGLIGGAAFTMASHGADQLMVQRYLCSRSLGQARTALILSGFVVLVQFLLFLLIGIGLYGLVQSKQLTVPPGTPNDEVFGSFITDDRFLPHGLIGLVIAAVLAAAMSTLSSSLNSSANAFVTDFYRPLRPGRGEGHYLGTSRLMTSLWGLAQIGVALTAAAVRSERSIVALVLSVAGFTTGMILGLFLLGSLRRPVRSGAALTGLVAGFLTVLFFWLPSVGRTALSNGRRLPGWLLATWGESPLPGPLAAWAEYPLAWPWYAPLGAGVTVLVALLVNRLVKYHGSPANGGPQPGLNQP